MRSTRIQDNNDGKPQSKFAAIFKSPQAKAAGRVIAGAGMGAARGIGGFLGKKLTFVAKLTASLMIIGGGLRVGGGLLFKMSDSAKAIIQNSKIAQQKQKQGIALTPTEYNSMAQDAKITGEIFGGAVLMGAGFLAGAFLNAQGKQKQPQDAPAVGVTRGEPPPQPRSPGNTTAHY